MLLFIHGLDFFGMRRFSWSGLTDLGRGLNQRTRHVIAFSMFSEPHHPEACLVAFGGRLNKWTRRRTLKPSNVRSRPMEVKRDSSHLMSGVVGVLARARSTGRGGRPLALKAPLGPLARAKEEEERATGGADGPSAEPSPLRQIKNARCGTCEACLAKDCGRCKNCLDKPR